jgi:hypothetical protein
MKGIMTKNLKFLKLRSGKKAVVRSNEDVVREHPFWRLEMEEGYARQLGLQYRVNRHNLYIFALLPGIHDRWGRKNSSTRWSPKARKYLYPTSK